MTETHRDTIMRLLVEVGGGCERLLDDRMRGLACRRLQVDEAWSFVGKKQRHLTRPMIRSGLATCGPSWPWTQIRSLSRATGSARGTCRP